ncbi:MAG: NADH-quinone oxidoreductase subunit H [Desulfobulbaceae bacterium]|nr:NADH-quinone oxidoreductase subunit H [Desulfobulbaceae bacterium]
MNVLQYLFFFFIFPGFLFTAAFGLMTTWVDRKVTAKLQWRVGPPFAQPFYDVVKLLGKENIIPKNAHPIVFILAPMLGLTSITVISVILWVANITRLSFVGDLIVVSYLLLIPSLALMLGGFASGNPYAVTGSSREMKLILGYELPYLFVLLTVIVKNGMSIQLSSLPGNSAIFSLSGIIAFLVALFCIQAKLGLPPFDVAEAETELMEGPYIEYSGTLLAIYKLTQAMALFTLPIFLITMFLGGMNFSGENIVYTVLKFILVLLLMIVLKNTNPRIRIDQGVKFFWLYLTPLAVLALLLAVIGNVYHIVWL